MGWSAVFTSIGFNQTNQLKYKSKTYLYICLKSFKTKQYFFVENKQNFWNPQNNKSLWFIQFTVHEVQLAVYSCVKHEVHRTDVDIG